MTAPSNGWSGCSCWHWPIERPFDHGSPTRLPTFQSRNRTWRSSLPGTTIESTRHGRSFLIEVSDSSLSKDRRVKTRIYAAAAVPEYWVVDVNAGTIEVRTQPRGDGYGQLRIARPGQTIRLQAFPDVEIAVSDVVR